MHVKYSVDQHRTHINQVLNTVMKQTKSEQTKKKPEIEPRLSMKQVL